MRNWITRILGLAPNKQIDVLLQREIELERRVGELEQENANLKEQLNRERPNPGIEDRIQAVTGKLGKYARKNKEELDEIISEIGSILDAIETIINTVELQPALDRVKALKRRLNNNLTRAENAKRSIAA
ncbi:MAG: hypothetical protein KJ587_14270 [Alphaproteobacteria bacterium]|nr:hypothetical protein [Alphaproteobacteria bacterium]